MAKKRRKSKKKRKPEEEAIDYLTQTMELCIQKINEDEPSDAVKLKWVHALSQTCAALSNMKKIYKPEDEESIEDWLNRVVADISDKENRELAKKEALMAIKAFKNGNGNQTKQSDLYVKG